MTDSEEITTNLRGGKQSKLYVAYDLIDPWAMQILAAVHHRGSIKYGPDNWRNISTDDHVNHALHHIMKAIEMLTRRRLGRPSTVESEDHLAHALCRLTFAVATEISNEGCIHPEHSDPAYHEPKATPIECNVVRDAGPQLGPVPTTTDFDERARSFAALANKARRNDPIRTQKTSSSYPIKSRVNALPDKRRR